MVKEKLLEGLRGKKGGYRLTKQPDEYTVYDILKFSEKSLAPVACLECEVNTCERKENCRTLPMWEKLDKLLVDFFESVKLSDLAHKNQNVV